MKTRIATVLFSILLSTGLFAQDHSYDYNIKQPVGIASVNEAANIADRIVKAAGLKANFMIAEAKVPNALAVLQNGRRYILYNPDFVNQLTRATGTSWAAVSVLAHEIGHHLYNTLAGKPSRTLATELEADKFSGYVLEKMGASLEEAQAAMNVLATPYATVTHPARADRIESIAKGWSQAGGIITEKEQNNNTTGFSRSTASSMLARLVFNNSPGRDYFITKRLNVVRVEDDGVLLIGRLSKSSNEDYPYIITDGDGFRLYINSEGKIINSRGIVIGRITEP